MYKPVWKDVKGYAKGLSKSYLNNFKSVKYDRSDLLQDAYVIFLECQIDNTFDNKQHFISYFWRAYNNFLITASKKPIRQFNYVSGINIEEYRDQLIQEETVTFKAVLKEMPNELKEVFNIMLNAPTEMIEALGFRTDYFQLSDGKVSRLLGKPDFKFKKVLKDFCNQF